MALESTARPGDPPDPARGDVGNGHHSGKPFRAPFQEKATVPESLAGKSCRLKGLAQPAARRLADTQAAYGIRADAP